MSPLTRSPGLRRPLPGFTLIELMIVLAIVVILVAVAVPSYGGYLKKGRRAEAQAYLQALAMRQQQFLVDTRSYASLATLAVPMPSSVADNYTVSVRTDAGPPPAFTVTAVPKGSQASERCGTLSIDQAGTKGAAVSGCW